MYPNNFKQLNLSAGVRQILWLLLILWVLSIGGGFLLRGFVLILGLIIVAPVVGFFGLQWWLRQNIVQGECPVCHYELTGLNNQAIVCPSCDESLQIADRKFQRIAQDGVIDIDAVEVDVSVVEEPKRS